jgi:hypothetical protein
MAGWMNVLDLEPIRFECGFCGADVASEKGYTHSSDPSLRIMICPNCSKPSFFISSIRFPSPLPGSTVGDLPSDIQSLYQEARASSGANAHTAAVLVCRKLLMNIAVKQEAALGKSFLEYVEFLAERGYVPPNGKEWVDHIREKGNEATHEIVIMTKEDAEDLIGFIEMLLRFIYEFPAKIRKKANGQSSNS